MAPRAGGECPIGDWPPETSGCIWSGNCPGSPPVQPDGFQLDAICDDCPIQGEIIVCREILAQPLFDFRKVDGIPPRHHLGDSGSERVSSTSEEANWSFRSAVEVRRR
jgi:hypothetical protein